jgi:isoleucyl-tRNA synthetase
VNKQVEQSENNETQGPFDFVQSEHEILAFWKKQDVFKKSLDQTRDKPPYIFYDGPPFATGLPHHGHLVGSILKDAVPRFFTMRGRYVERRFGWDCHGLPIEHEIDKKLGKSAHDAIKDLGIKGYNDECRGIVQRYTSEWEKTITRIGRWVDFKNDYKTMDISFMESVWWVFKQLWEKDLVYQGTKVVPFSTALGTVLSNFEAGLNYQDVQDPAVTVLFKLDEKLGGDETFIAAWTTTPWTLPSNLGLCVGPEIEYVKIFDRELGKHILMASTRVEQYSKKRQYDLKETYQGTHLVGKKYHPLFPYFSDLKKQGAFTVLADSYVTTDNGTGVVHLAPAFGEDDNRVMKAAGILTTVCPIDDAGKFTSEITDYRQQYVKDADKQIMRDLKADGRLYEQGTLVHSYPFCYRSDTPLLYRSIPSWYVRVENIKEDLLKSNNEINWVPDHIKVGRFGKWLEGARDWAISRNRVWGTPLPVWINDESGQAYCIGSLDELQKLTGHRPTDLHREFVDQLTFQLPNEKGTYRRITEVFDCWFESGSMPYAQLHYPFENKELFENGFPAEFIAEGLDQTRGWFYTLTILSTALYKRPAFKNVIVNGIVMAEDGKKMSKRLKNYTSPDQLMETYGADALRLYLITSGLVKAEEQRFADSGVKDMVRRALLPWFNAYKFFATYAHVDGWRADKHTVTSDNITDRWILSNLQTLKANIIKEMEAYRLYNVVPALFTFIEDLTNWYIRLNRPRFWTDKLDNDKKAAYTTLYTAVKELSTAMAPFAPFLAEHIYRELEKYGPLEKPSVHLCNYPVANTQLMDPLLEEAMGRMQQVILLGRQKRIQTQIKVKTPLRKLAIIHKDNNLLNEIKKLEYYIKSELNIKEVIYTQDEEKYIRLYAKPNSPVLGPRMGKRFGEFNKAIAGLSASQLSQYEQKGSLEILGENLREGDLLIFREALPGTQSLSNRFISIELDTTLDRELELEGLARELVSRIQKMRKESGLQVDDRIVLGISGSADIDEAFTKHLSHIKSETLAADISDLKKIGKEKAQEHEIEGKQCWIYINKA